jgi:hypothetical protein
MLQRITPAVALALVSLALVSLAACRDGGTGPKPAGNCSSGAALDLAPGDIHVLTGPERNAICLQGSSTGSEYVLVPVYTSTVASQNVQVEVLGDHLVPVTGAPTPHIAGEIPGVSLSRGAERSPFGAADVAERFEFGLRQRERRDLQSRLAAAHLARSMSSSVNLSRLAPSLAVGQVGDTVTYNVRTDSACKSPVYHKGVVKAVTQHAVVVADVGNPTGGFSDQEYASFGVAFDTLVWAVDTDNFGTPADMGNTGHIVIFFTRAVNELTAPNSNVFVGGFFFARDLFPPSDPNPGVACPGSNATEMFYMLVPDPTGAINGNTFATKAYVENSAIGILAHEFQHLINGSLKFVNPQATAFEEVWLNEGLSHIAEELMFYRVSGLGPRQHIDGPKILASQQIRDAFNGYQSSNFGRLDEYLPNPETQSPYAANDSLATRGATWQLLRYTADRKGGDERTFWRGLTGSAVLGIANLEAQAGIPVPTLVRGWAGAQYLSDTRAGIPAEYEHQSWNFRDLYPRLRGRNGPHGPFRLLVHPLAANTQQMLTLRGGGAAYLRFGVTASTAARVQVTSQSAPVPAAVELILARTQ